MRAPIATKMLREWTRPALKPDDPEQSKRFIEAARGAEVDETEKGAERAFKAVARSKLPKPNK
jgi:hypothetical protein